MRRHLMKHGGKQLGELVDVTAQFELHFGLKQCDVYEWQGTKVRTYTAENFWHVVITRQDNIHSAFTYIDGGAKSTMIVYADDEDYVKGWQCFQYGLVNKTATTVLEWPAGATRCYVSSMGKNTLKLFRYEQL